MLIELEKWLNNITTEQIKNNMVDDPYFEENIDCDFAIPFDLAVQVIKREIPSIKNAVSWLHDNQLWLQIVYHTDGYPTYIGLSFENDLKALDVDESIIQKIDESFKEILKNK